VKLIKAERERERSINLKGSQRTKQLRVYSVLTFQPAYFYIWKPRYVS
jgi:hypothetical protein